MGKGINIYFTEKEALALISAATEYISVLSEGEESAEYAESMLNDGLGSALYKLYKGRVGQVEYAEYCCKKRGST